MNDINEVIKYMEDYVKCEDMQYSEPMLNYKHLQLILNEIERLNDIINKAIHFINLNQDEKKLTLNYDDLKKLRGILKNDDFYLRLFEEQLEELKGSDKKC